MVFFSSAQEATQRLNDLVERAYQAYYQGTGGQVWRHDEQTGSGRSNAQ